VATDIISTWREYTAGLPTADIFSELAGVFLVSAALQRRVFYKTDDIMPWAFPNLYVCLVGPPGAGKDIAINPVSSLLREATRALPQGQGFFLGPESLSSKGLIDALASDPAKFTLRYVNGSGKEELAVYHSLIGCVPELGTLIPEYDVRFISILNDLYNCKEDFQDRIRGNEVNIPNPHVALLLGTQPDTLAKILPETTFQMGFTSRIIFTYAHAPTLVSLFGNKSSKNKRALRNQVLERVLELAQISGEIKATPEAEQLLDNFHLVEGGATRVKGSRFEHYNTRRSLHLIKLSMIMCFSSGTKKLIEKDHVLRAKDLLLRVEKLLPGIFQNIATDRGFHSTVEAIVQHHTVITHGQLVAKLRRTHPANLLPQIIRSMLEAGDITQKEIVNGQPIYITHQEHK
jgi:hypothetical protein